MLNMTVEEAAQAARVTPKTIRQWIRDEGLPVLQHGDKGAGNGAIVDGARLPGWLMRHNNPAHTSIADFFKSSRPGKNPLRDICDVQRRGMLWTLANALHDWANKPEAGAVDYRPEKLSKQQARAVAFQVWSLAALAFGAYLQDRVDIDVSDELGTDLDELLSLLTEGDFHTSWPPLLIEFPPKIMAMAPRSVAEKIRATAGGDEGAE